jgi:predicted O-linked N-acetylglucosamine transferase (SPINDLY family)
MISKAETFRDGGNPSEARTILEDLLTTAPNYPQIHYNLGVICMELHENQAACDHFHTLVQLQPDFLEGRMLLGMMLAELGQHEEAINLLREVLEICPDLPEVRHRLGLSLAELHRYEEAFQEYQTVLQTNPDNTSVLCALGLLLTTTGQIGEARRVLLQALETKPDAVNVINNLARICKIGRADEALEWFQRGLDFDPEHPALTSNYLYTLNYVPDLSPECIARKYREYAPRAFHPPEGWQPYSHAPKPAGSKIRIGYVSADFYGHSVAFFLEPVLQQHDLNQFEIFCYYNRTFEDDTTHRLKNHCIGWHCIVGLSDRQVADLIAADRIDILVDLSGHTSGHRLGVFALQPAPVQASWIGHPNTTGLPQVDYYITDAQCDPPGMTEQLYSEKLCRLPRTFCCYLPPEEFPPVAPVPSLATKHITFGCFNSLTKINALLISWWSDILAAVPGSQMFIKGPALDDPGTRNDLLELFAGYGIAAERLIVQGVTGTRTDHLARYTLVDVALDSFPYHGTTTTCEAMWMGVPVITLAGNSHVSRVGVSLLHSVGLDELIAKTPEEYIALAISLANNKQRLTDLRENLRSMLAHSPLMDAAGVTCEVENAYRKMLQKNNYVRIYETTT